MLTQDALDALWGSGDPATAEARLREAAAAAESSADRAELETQVARSLGLQGRPDEGLALLDAVALGPSAGEERVRARVAIERGRLVEAAGSPGDALPQFEAAATLADRAGSAFLRLEALHMIAVVAPQRAEHVTAQALEELEAIEDPRARRWSVALHGDLGRIRFDAGDLEGALEEFEAALSSAQVWGTAEEAGWAREAIDECRDAIQARNTAGEA